MYSFLLVDQESAALQLIAWNQLPMLEFWIACALTFYRGSGSHSSEGFIVSVTQAGDY
jgi:hypothetical protein